MYCSKCGTQIDDDSLFCPNCGTRAQASGAPASTPVPPVQAETPVSNTPKRSSARAR
jgi:Predicted membrane protein